MIPRTVIERARLVRQAFAQARIRQRRSMRENQKRHAHARAVLEGRTPNPTPPRVLSPWRERFRVVMLVKRTRAHRLYTRHDVRAQCVLAADIGLRRGWDASLGRDWSGFQREAENIADQVLASPVGRA